MALKATAKLYLNELKEKWQQLQDTPGVFAYKLNVTQRKCLLGTRFFYSELNPERSELRRTPQMILKLSSSFNKEKFNFQKINQNELIMNIPYENVDVSLIINKSPLTRYHTLICPDIPAGYPQMITPFSLNFSVEFLRGIVDEDPAYRIGYNSPGALASVNHLHLHLVHIESDLYIDKARLQSLDSSYVYRLSADMPTEAICFLIQKSDTDEEVKYKLFAIYEYLMWLCEQNMPHNLFITQSRDQILEGLKIFVYARKNYCIIKDLSQYNIGFCELSGYIPIGDKEVFTELTEQKVVARIREETGTAYPLIYDYFIK